MKTTKDWSTARFSYKQEFNHYKRDSIQAAMDLGYSKDIIDKIRCAETMNEISKIMRSARTGDDSAAVNNWFNFGKVAARGGIKRHV